MAHIFLFLILLLFITPFFPINSIFTLLLFIFIWFLFNVVAPYELYNFLYFSQPTLKLHLSIKYNIILIIVFLLYILLFIIPLLIDFSILLV